LKDL
jgi:hypothetical protein